MWSSPIQSGASGIRHYRPGRGVLGRPPCGQSRALCGKQKVFNPDSHKLCFPLVSPEQQRYPCTLGERCTLALVSVCEGTDVTLITQMSQAGAAFLMSLA